MSDARHTTTHEHIYGPDDIRAMRSAFDRSWDALAFAAWRDEHDVYMTRERLARAILQVAAGGERRVATLTNCALGSIEPKSAAVGNAGGETWPATGFAS